MTGPHRGSPFQMKLLSIFVPFIFIAFAEHLQFVVADEQQGKTFDDNDGG